MSLIGTSIVCHTKAWPLMKAIAISATTAERQPGVGAVAALGGVQRPLGEQAQGEDRHQHHVRGDLGDDVVDREALAGRRPRARGAAPRSPACRRSASSRRGRRGRCRRAADGAVAASATGGRARYAVGGRRALTAGSLRRSCRTPATARRRSARTRSCRPAPASRRSTRSCGRRTGCGSAVSPSPVKVLSISPANASTANAIRPWPTSDSEFHSSALLS